MMSLKVTFLETTLESLLNSHIASSTVILLGALLLGFGLDVPDEEEEEEEDDDEDEEEEATAELDELL